MMKKLRTCCRLIALPIAAIMVLLAMPYGAAQAEMISTEQAIAGPANARTNTETRSQLLRLLQQTDVQAEMRALGVDPAEAAERVGAMTDSEIQHIAGRIDTLPGGGNPFTTVLVLATVAAVVFGLLVGALAYFAFSSSSDESPSPPPRSN